MAHSNAEPSCETLVFLRERYRENLNVFFLKQKDINGVIQLIRDTHGMLLTLTDFVDTAEVYEMEQVRSKLLDTIQSLHEWCDNNFSEQLKFHR